MSNWISSDGGEGSIQVESIPLTGDGLYEVFRTHHGVAVTWDRHWARMCGSARALSMTMPEEGEVLAGLDRLLAKQRGAHVLRLVVARPGRPGKLSRPTKWWLMSAPCVPAPRAIELVTSPHPIPDVDWMRHKTLSNMDRILALAWAHERGADDTLRVDVHGGIAETAVAALLVKLQGRWHWPQSSSALPSITARLLSECSDVPTIAAVLPREILSDIESACVCSSARGVVPVARLDGRELVLDSAWAQDALDNYLNNVASRMVKSRKPGL